MAHLESHLKSDASADRQTRRPMRPALGSGGGHDHVPAGGAAVTAPPLVVYIDKQRLGRDCVGERLAFQLPQWRIEPVESIRDTHSDLNCETSLVVLHARSASLRTAEIAEEMAAIEEIAPGVPLVLMSD